jgi:tetratricopeptide (TPR) repeat protein
MAAQNALGELVSYSLLVRKEKDYTVSHALVYTYARERLWPPADVVSRLAVHFRTWLEEQGPLRKETFAQLAEGRPHILAVLTACRDHEQWQPAMELTAAVDNYLAIGGYWSERVTANQIGLLAARALQDRGNEGAWLGNLGIAYRNLGQSQQAIGYYEQALAIAQEISDRRSEGAWLGNLGIAYRNLGQSQQARQTWEQSLQIFEEIKSPDAERVRGLLAQLAGQE